MKLSGELGVVTEEHDGPTTTMPYRAWTDQDEREA